MFWKNHDSTQGNQQGEDIGTQYRSALFYTSNEQLDIIKTTMTEHQRHLDAENKGKITTDITKFEDFYYAEDYHQQYLYKNPTETCKMSNGWSSEGSACAFRMKGAPKDTETENDTGKTEL